MLTMLLWELLEALLSSFAAESPSSEEDSSTKSAAWPTGADDGGGPARSGALLSWVSSCTDTCPTSDRNEQSNRAEGDITTGAVENKVSVMVEGPLVFKQIGKLIAMKGARQSSDRDGRFTSRHLHWRFRGFLV